MAYGRSWSTFPHTNVPPPRKKSCMKPWHDCCCKHHSGNFHLTTAPSGGSRIIRRGYLKWWRAKRAAKFWGVPCPQPVQTPPPKPIESVKVRSHVSTYDQRTGNLQETKDSQHNRYKKSCMVINVQHAAVPSLPSFLRRPEFHDAPRVVQISCTRFLSLAHGLHSTADC